MNHTVTMKEIAAHAGVTQATVSMSLANHLRISAKTRTRIQEIARRLGYRPNPYVIALMRGRRRRKAISDKPVLALVNALDSATAWRDSQAVTVRQMRAGALERAEARGYEAREFWLHQDGMSEERFSSVLHHRGIQGVLLGPQSPGAALPLFNWDHFAAVRLGVPLRTSTVTSVCNDHFFSSLQSVQECYRLGYRRPGLVVLKQHRERFSARWDGGILVGRHMLPELRPARTLQLDAWDNLTELEEWIRSERVDVVISPSADRLHAHLLERGWKCPEDVGIVSLACPEKGHWCSGIWQNGSLLGATAIDQLISMLERNERGLPIQTHVTMVEGVWNPGNTLRAVHTSTSKKIPASLRSEVRKPARTPAKSRKR